MRTNTTLFSSKNLAIAQGIYYFLTGIWPILHIESFMEITGPKMDIWLVKTVGTLIAVIGLGLAISGFKKQVNFSIAFIAAASAAGLMLVDIIYVWLLVIPPVYLLDAVAELIIILLWLGEFYRYRKLRTEKP